MLKKITALFSKTFSVTHFDGGLTIELHKSFKIQPSDPGEHKYKSGGSVLTLAIDKSGTKLDDFKNYAHVLRDRPGEQAATSDGRLIFTDGTNILWKEALEEFGGTHWYYREQTLNQGKVYHVSWDGWSNSGVYRIDLFCLNTDEARQLASDLKAGIKVL